MLIRAGLVGALAVLCYRVFAPFLPLMVWSIILAVTMYPLHQWFARKVRGKQGLASTILVIVGILLIVVPTALLMSSFADSVRNFINAAQNNTLTIPAPRDGRGGMADRRQEDLRPLVESSCRPAWTHSEHAAEDR